MSYLHCCVCRDDLRRCECGGYWESVAVSMASLCLYRLRDRPSPTGPVWRTCLYFDPSAVLLAKYTFYFLVIRALASSCYIWWIHTHYTVYLLFIYKKSSTKFMFSTIFIWFQFTSFLLNYHIKRFNNLKNALTAGISPLAFII